MLKILRPGDREQAAFWDGFVNALPRAMLDIHFTSAYARVQEKTGSESLLAVWCGERGYILQPFIKRPTPFAPKLSDLCSPYGYGGPLGVVVDKEYERVLHEWANKENIVSEFCYMHPLIEQKEWVSGPMRTVRDIVVVDLAPLDEAKFARRVKRGINKATEAKARVIVSGNLRLFYELFAASMERKKAPQRWRWSEDYIAAHFRENLDARLFHVAAGGGIRMLMTVGAFGTTAYAHLLSSNGEATGLGLDELLYSEAAKQLRDDGYRAFHLGGGMSSYSDDNLLMFKSGFAEPKHKLVSYRRIFFNSIYEELCRRKRQEEVDQLGHVLDSDFFPAYRREAA